MDDIYDRLRKRASGPPLSKPIAKPALQSPQVAARPAPESLWARSTVREAPPPRKPKSKRRRAAITILLILLIACSSAGALYLKQRNTDKSSSAQEQPAPAESSANQNATGPIRLVATGDMIAHDSINQNARKADGSYDYFSLMDKMKPYFEKADLAFCNQSTPAGGEQFGISGYPVFNAPIEFARGLEAVGCNLINLGTNHTNDKGQALVDATVAAWDNRGSIVVVGANRSVEEQQKLRVFEIKGMRFAFLSYSTYTNKPVTNGFAVDMYNETTAKTEVTAARTKADFVIVSMRWGTEYSPDANAEQDQIAKVLADAGADVVLGHGPHDMQPVKRVMAADGREVPVWFSLGNFLNSQLEIQNLIGGFAVMDIDPGSKKITSLSFLPVYQHYEWTAQQKARGSAADLAARTNFQMVPLDQAADLLAKSHHNTTVQAQTDRVKQLLNKFTEVPIITSSQY